MIIIIFVAVSFINYLVITGIVDIILMGKLYFRFDKYIRHSEYLILKNNRIDIQTGIQCSAYSSAYVLRHFGIEADAENLYKEMPGKMKSGYVYPKGIQNLLSDFGLRVKYCAGNLNSLKNDLSAGNPVIVMIKTRVDEKYLHYVPVVGYDEKNIYIAESLKEFENCSKGVYNRRIDNQTFLKLWNTGTLKMPFYRNTYFVIKR